MATDWELTVAWGRANVARTLESLSKAPVHEGAISWLSRIADGGGENGQTACRILDAKS